MIHTFKAVGQPMLLDVGSGAVHAIDDMAQREAAMDNMRELFRQFMSVLILEKTRLEENNIFIDQRISFREIDRYFFTGCACAFFQIAVDTYTDLSFNPDEWTTPLMLQ